MLVDVFEFVFTEAYDVAVAQRMLFDELAVDIRAVGAAEVFQEGVVEDRDDEGVFATDGKVVDLDVVIGLPADGNAFLLKWEFPLNCSIHTQNHLRHRSVLFSCPFSESC